jgi:deoxyuridine 5'-triphosphate nucleotidohydrolase
MDYFKKIDNDEKAYILGLVNKNKNFITTGLCTNKNVLEILSNFCGDVKNLYMIDIDDAQTLTDIQNSTLEFKNFNEDFKIAYIRGLYESGLPNKIEINDVIQPIINDIIDFIFKDIKYDIIDYYNSKIIIIKNTYYKNKFLNIIYKSKSSSNQITILNNHAKNLVLYEINNNKPDIKVFKTDENAVIPTKAFEEDVGYDLTIIKKLKDFNSKTSLYDTGIKIEIDEGYYTEIVPRSSISKSGYILANNIGIIDNHYRGNLMIALTKIADDAPDIQLPFKCCQLIVRKQIFSNLIEVVENDFSETKRNDGGFGSTS